MTAGENKTLGAYREGMINWTEDIKGYYLNTDQNLPENVNWQVFASILAAAAVYE
ncbi:hypothetical protein QE357_004748 [Siphonobacter sp. BAB-5404]|nr:hypothetical protein [Siphonobacter sp. SORGH_AS_0500]